MTKRIYVHKKAVKHRLRSQDSTFENLVSVDFRAARPFNVIAQQRRRLQ